MTRRSNVLCYGCSLVTESQGLGCCESELCCDLAAKSLSLRQRLILIRQLPPDARSRFTVKSIVSLVVALALEIGDVEGLELFLELESLLNGGDEAEIYRSAFLLLAHAQQQNDAATVIAADLLVHRFDRRLLYSSYVLGNVEEELQWDRVRDTWRMQWRVQYGDMKYLQESSQYAYLPQLGDTVLIDRMAARMMRKDVAYARFIPISGGEY